MGMVRPVRWSVCSTTLSAMAMGLASNALQLQMATSTNYGHS